MWPALGSYDLNLDQSGTSIQILPEPNAGHVTRFFYEITTLTTLVRKSIIATSNMMKIIAAITAAKIFAPFDTVISKQNVYKGKLKM